MRDLLRETIKFSSIAKIEGLRVEGTDKETTISAVDEGKDLIIISKPKQVIPEFIGEFGIPQIKLLESLLTFDGFAKGESEIVRFTRRNRDKATGVESEMEAPQQMRFREAKGGTATFWFSHGQHLPAGADTSRIPWDVVIKPTKDAAAEFTKLAMIFATPECRFFGMKTVEGNLRFTFGTQTSTTHHGEMVFQEDVKGRLSDGLSWDSGKFIAILKVASGRDFSLSITSKGLLCVSFETDHADYHFYLLCTKAD